MVFQRKRGKETRERWLVITDCISWAQTQFKLSSAPSPTLDLIDGIIVIILT